AVLAAGCFTTLTGALVTGILVYKTRYAGEKFFHKDDDHGGAEVFNMDKEFTGPDQPEDYKNVEYPPEIEESVEGFEKQFGMAQMIKAAQNYNIEDEVEDAA
ncbi:MAG: hypothetical protein KAJ73_10290, partial [Zetaproteobacteria bacterium]|nr:hypothetical protein [Zetaproteobacteria bacterium]